MQSYAILKLFMCHYLRTYQTKYKHSISVQFYIISIQNDSPMFVFPLKMTYQYYCQSILTTCTLHKTHNYNFWAIYLKMFLAHNIECHSKGSVFFYPLNFYSCKKSHHPSTPINTHQHPSHFYLLFKMYSNCLH